MTDLRTLKLVQIGALIGATLTTFFFFTPALDPFNLPKSVLLIGTAAAVCMSLVAARTKDLRARLVTAIPLTALLIAMIISAVTGSASVHRVLFGAYSRATGLLSYTAMILIAIGLSITVRKSTLNFTYVAIGAVATFEVIYGFLQLVGADPIKWVNPYNPVIGSLGNPNFMSATLAFSSLGVVAVALSSRPSKTVRILSATLSVCGLLMAWSTNSVQGPIAFAGGLTFLLGVFLWLKRPKSSLLIGYTSLAALMLGVVVLGVAKIGPLSDILYRYTLGIRTHYWGAAWHMMTANPLTGVGVDSYGESYRAYRDLAFVQSNGPTLFSNAAHSVPLQLGATLGLPTFILYIALQGYVLLRGIKALKIHEHYRVEIAGVIAAWLAFQAQSLISIDQLGLAVWGWVLTGVILGLSHEEFVEVELSKRDKRRQQRNNNSRIGVASVLGATGLIVGVLLGWQAMLPDLHLRNAFAIPATKDNQQAISLKSKAIVDAARENQEDASYLSQAVNELLTMGESDNGVNLAKLNASLHPKSFDAQQAMASISEQMNVKKQAIIFRQRMTVLDPYNWQNWLVYGQDLEAIGNQSEAKSAYQKVIALSGASAEAKTAQDALKRLG